MARRSPLNMTLGPDWRQRVMNALSEYEEAPNTSPVVKDILDHPEAEKAFKYILDAVDGNERKKKQKKIKVFLIHDVMAKSLGICSVAFINKCVSPYVTANHLKNIESLIGVVGIYSKFGKYSLYEMSGNVEGKEFSQKIDNTTIAAAFHILRDVLQISLADPVNTVGRPIQFNKHILIFSLARHFRSSLGRPVHGAIAGLVNATFCQKSMTEDRVKKILSSPLLRAYKSIYDQWSTPIDSLPAHFLEPVKE